MNADLVKLQKEILVDPYIYGWKGLAAYYGCFFRSLQRWHAIRPIPWERVGNGQGRVRIHRKIADIYYRVPKTLSALKKKNPKDPKEYPIQLSWDKKTNSWYSCVQGVDGCYSSGETPTEAVSNLAQALATYFEV